jgi:uncharacterized protein
MTERHTVLWRRLDVPGHDACRFTLDSAEWTIEGTAVFLHEGAPTWLAYTLMGDGQWRTRRGHINGIVGSRVVDVAIERAINGTWRVDGQVAPGLEPYVHLDFGFTPATNFPHLRRLALAAGQAADLPVAWLDVPPCELRVLRQRYERRSASTYWYDAPDVGYAALLELTPDGLISRYPGLWELEK